MKSTNYGKSLKKYFAISALLFVLQPQLSAETSVGEKAFSIGPRAIRTSPRDADEGTWSAGGQVRLHLTPALGLEGSIDYVKNDYGPLTTIKTYPVQASLLAYLMPNSTVCPFLLGGVGWYYTQVNGAAGYDGTDSRFGLHAGFGGELMINKSLSLDATYRYIWLETVASKDAGAIDKDYDDSGSMFTIGLNFLF